MATAIVGIVLMPIYALQGQMMARIMRAAADVHRMFVAFDFFVTTQRPRNDGQEKKIEKSSDDPVIHMSFEQEDVSANSTLKKAFNNLRLEKISWHWSADGKKKKDQFTAILFEPPEPEPEKKEADEKKEPDAKSPAKPAGGKA